MTAIEGRDADERIRASGGAERARYPAGRVRTRVGGQRVRTRTGAPPHVDRLLGDFVLVGP
jgi:hypothetical protein